jgi:ParB/RepB/Spo0J family partition protein
MKLALARIWIRPAENVSRNGQVDTRDAPKVLELADSMARGGQQEPVLVRAIPTSLAAHAPAGTDRLLVFGFRRALAAQVLGWTEIDAMERDLDDEAAIEANVAENFIRDDPSDYQVAQAFLLLKRRCGFSAEEIALRVYGDRATNARRARVEQLLRIVERCPKRLLEIWQREPTVETRRALERIARIDGATVAERHRAMIDAWAAELVARERRASVPHRGRGAPKGPRALPASGVQALRETLRSANAYVDPMTGMLKPLDDETKRAIDAVLRHVAAPKDAESPLRG